MDLAFALLAAEYYSTEHGGALATITSEVARDLERRGHTVRVVARRMGELPQGGHFVELRRTPLRVGRAAANRVLRVARLPSFPDDHADRVAATIQSAPPQVLVTYNDFATATALACACPTTSVVLWLQNQERVTTELVRQAVSTGVVIVACSSFIARWTEAEYGLESSTVRVVASGVNVSTFSPAAREVPPPLRCLFIGRLDPNKGPDLALQAVASLREQGLEAAVEIAGDRWWYGSHGRDEFVRRLHELAKDVGATMLGHVPRRDVPAVYRRNHVVLVLSRAPEPFGLVVLEAMASGCAVVASNRGGLPEACGGAASLVDPEDLEAVVDTLRSLSDAPTLALQVERGFRRAKSATWRKVTADLLAVVQEE